MALVKEAFNIEGTGGVILETEAPDAILIQPCDEHDRQGLDSEAAILQAAGKRFCLAAFRVKDWNRDLSPWAAPPAFGPEPFGDGAAQTLAFVEGALLPWLKAAYPAAAKVILGGYSLAGLFSLWSAYRTNAFDGIAAVSPSVWFDGWIDFAAQAQIRTEQVYLSLGDREHRTRNDRMKTVRERIIRQEALLRQAGVCCTLVWNEGNHFREPDRRVAEGFAWLLS